MTTTTITSPRVYVGTYGKYNSGSIAGAWLDLENYSDKDTFLAACEELHKDEYDPEFMFQDWEGIPGQMISESHIDSEVFAWLDLDDDDRELLAAYVDNIDVGATIEDARDAYMGRYDSQEHWAEDFLSDTGALESVPENLRYYIDFLAYARDACMSGDVTFIPDAFGGVMVFRDA